MLDDFVLWVQAFVDRVARWARFRLSAPRGGRRFLIVQIDGLSREVLARALSSRRAPVIARLMAPGRLRWRDLSVGIPSSTPAFQAALMYGVHPDIPGFHWYDKRERADRLLPAPGGGGSRGGAPCAGAAGHHGGRDFPARLKNGGHEISGIRMVAAGPNAFVYFTDAAEPLTAEEIEHRYPGAGAALSGHPGVGFVLARSPDGPVCWHGGRQVSLGPGSRGGPFEQRPDREVVLNGLRELMAMPSAGDLVLYGIGAPGGDVSFLDERGAHAGPSPAELHTFILHPPAVTLPETPLTHPAQLYPHFAAYRDGTAA